MSAFRIFTAASLMAALWAGSAIGDDAKPAVTYATLTAAGYEVRAVNLIPSEDREAMVADGKSPAVFVTLQRGPSTAVCQFGATSWTNLTPGAMELAGRCVLYPPAP
jgi:hypothetical protein